MSAADGIPFFSRAYKFNSGAITNKVGTLQCDATELEILGLAHMRIYNSHEESKEKLYAQVEDIRRSWLLRTRSRLLMSQRK